MVKNISEDFEIRMPNPVAHQMKSSMAINHRKIVINDDIDENTSFEFMYFINKLRDNDEKFNTKEPIEVMVNTNGGIIYDCFVIVDIIEQLKNNGYDVITTNISKAYSAGMAIALCGSTRKSYKRARYMWHDASAMTVGKVQDMKEQLEEIDTLRKMFFNIITQYSNISVEEMRVWTDKKLDKFFSAQEMFELKGVDIVI